MREIFGLLITHIEMKKLEAKEGTEFLVEWYGDTPIVQEIHQKPAARPRNQVLHIQAAAQHRRLMEQILQEQSGGSSLSAAPNQGQAAWQGRHETHSLLDITGQCQLGRRVTLHTGSARLSGLLGSRDKVWVHGLGLPPGQSQVRAC